MSRLDLPTDHLSVDHCLDDARQGRLLAPPELWGYGGLHGGLTLAALTAAATSDRSDHSIRGVTGQFHRPITDAASIETGIIRDGRSIRAASARAVTEGSVRATAVVTTGPTRSVAAPVAVAMAAPSTSAPEACGVLELPDENASITSAIEIRPASAGLPFSGSDVAELAAWIRLVADDDPPDPLRLILLADALAPSYAAVMTTLALMPTVELSVTLTGITGVDPWVLVRARSSSVSADGWIDERIDLWDRTGTHLVTARQLRLLVPL